MAVAQVLADDKQFLARTGRPVDFYAVPAEVRAGPSVSSPSWGSRSRLRELAQ